MRKTLLLFVLVLLGMGVQAQDGLYFGYCDGEIANSSRGTVTSKSGAGTIHAAVALQAEDLAKYVGCRIAAVNVGIAEKSPAFNQEVTAWVRADYKGEDLAHGTAQATTGWNKIRLEAPVTIEAGKKYYIGYSFQQTTSTKILSMVGEVRPEGVLIGKDEKWSDYSSRYGALSIEAWIEGDNLPGTDLSFSSLAPVTKKARRGEDLAFKGVVKNVGSKAIDRFVVEYTTNGHAQGSVEVVPSRPLEFRDTHTFTFSVPTEGVEGDAFRVDATLKMGTKDNPQDDSSMADNSRSATAVLFEEGFPHRVLLEEFTGEGCGYCPWGMARIRSAIEENDWQEQVSWICLHAVYEDYLTTDETRAYVALYDSKTGYYCPAMSVDRRVMPQFPCFTIEGQLTNGPVHEIGYEADIAEELAYVLDDVSFVRVTVGKAVEEKQLVTVDVTCEKVAAFDAVCPAPRLTVMVKEDNVEARRQSDYTGHFTGKHEHVFRKTLTAVWGDAIQWQGDTFTATYTYEIPEGVKAQDLSVVAFVHQCLPNDLGGQEVYNTAEAKVVRGNGAAVQTVEAALRASRSYNLQGQRVGEDYRGIVIRNGRKILNQ